MRKTQSRARPALACLILLIVALAVTACVAPSAPPATVSVQASPGAATQPAPQATTEAGPAAPAGTAEPGSQEPGASAALNPAAEFTRHWKGDPNAKVVIVEISDFQ